MTQEDDEYWESQHKKSNRPEDTAFKQQRLSAWKPVFTIRSMMPVFLVIGVLFMIIGGLLYGFVEAVTEVEIDYSDCKSQEFPQHTCAEIRSNASLVRQSCTCRLNFTLDKAWNQQVFLYYKLTNFYQNHRRYIDSRSETQLRGSVMSTSGCSPITTRVINYTDDSGERRQGAQPVAPCGLIANSIFNDTLSLFSTSTNSFVNLTRRGIAWKSDHDTKFRNPSGNLTEAFSQLAQPPNWQRSVLDLDPDDPDNNGFLNEDLIVWMRTAALSTFRKLYRRIPQGMTAGGYVLVVDYNFPTSGFDGKKYMILSTISWLGGRNTFLGIAYLTVGSLSLFISLVFFVLHACHFAGSSGLRRGEVL